MKNPVRLWREWRHRRNLAKKKWTEENIRRWDELVRIHNERYPAPETLAERFRRIVGSDDPEEVRRMLDQAHETRQWPAIAPSREPTAIELAAQLGK